MGPASIPWLEILFYIGVLFGPDDSHTLTVNFEENETVFTQVSAGVWQIMPDETWVRGDNAIIKLAASRPKTMNLAATKEISENMFDGSSIYQVSDGPLEDALIIKDESGMLVLTDIGESTKIHRIEWR